MRRTAAIWLTGFLSALGSLSAHADITIEYEDDSTAVVYRDGKRIYFETCNAGTASKRGCSGRELSTLLSFDRESYTRSVQTFFGLLDKRHSGIAGIVDLDRRIQVIKHRIETADLTTEELRQALEQLREWANWRGFADDAQRKILRYLEAGDDTLFNTRFQKERVEIAVFGFFGTTYLADQKRVYRVSEAVNWDQQATACKAIGESWKPTSDAHALSFSVRERLAQSPLANRTGTKWLWTSSMKLPRYRLDCHCRVQWERFRERTIEISIEQHQETMLQASLRKKSHVGDACYTFFGGACTFEQHISGYFTYLAREVTLLDLSSATNAGAIQTVPDNASIPHPVLCEKEFEPKSGVIPNAATAFDFSIANLDRSFENLAQLLYANRATFFRHLAKTVKSMPVSDDLAHTFRATQARAFALNVVHPLMHDIQTARIVEDILPVYDRALREWNTRLKLDSLGRIELTPETYRMALETFRAGLTAVQPYLTGDHVKAAEALARPIGQAMAKGPSALKEVVAALKEKQMLLTVITESARTHGFGATLQSILSYLEGKVGG